MSRAYVLTKPLFLFLFVLFALTCNNNPVKPEEDKPGRRDYVWTVDSVDYDTLPGRIEYTLSGGVHLMMFGGQDLLKM